jgi:hypothetical protein
MASPLTAKDINLIHKDNSAIFFFFCGPFLCCFKQLAYTLSTNSGIDLDKLTA